jgi:hypothetical protein
MRTPMTNVLPVVIHCAFFSKNVRNVEMQVTHLKPYAMLKAYVITRDSPRELISAGQCGRRECQ